MTLGERNKNMIDEQQKHRWWALVVLGLGLLITIVDASVVNIAAPAIQKDYGATMVQVELVISAYTMVFAATLILFGKMGAKYGFRRFEMIGAGLFGLASALVALSPSVHFMIVMRAVEGLGGAMIGPAGLALIHHIFKGKDRAIAFGIWGAVAGAGAAIGPLLGGYAVAFLSWEFAFWINVPFCILIILGARKFIVEFKSEDADQAEIDYFGAAIVGLALLGIVFGLIQGPHWGWWHARTSVGLLGVSPVPWLIAGGLILASIAFPEWVKRRKRQGKAPIFDLNLFKYRSFRSGLETSLFRQISQFALILTLAIFLQKGLGFSAWETGLVTMPAAIAGFIAGPLGGRFANRVGAKPIVILGIALQIIAAVVVMMILGPNVTGKELAIPVFIMGLGVALAASQLTNEVLAEVPEESAGDAGAANATVRQLGNSLATPMVGGLLAFGVADSLVAAFFFSLIALVLSFTLPNVRPSGSRAPSGE